MPSFWSRSSLIILLVWAALAIGFGIAIYQHQWSVAFVTFVTFLLSLSPFVIKEEFDVYIPDAFLAGVVLFIYATLFLGEISDFYTKFWWWDIILHGGSSIGFGLIGFVILLLLLQGSRFKADPFVTALFAFSFALSIGALWEIFEFSLDQLFGTHTQRSGLDDTMTDLIIDTGGAFFSSLIGFAYLKRGRHSFLGGVIHEAFRKNASLFREHLKKRRGSRGDASVPAER